MNQDIIEKYLNNNCTTDEQKKVSEWFATPDGQEYLRKRLDKDFQLIEDEKITPLIPETESQKIWDAIEEGIHDTEKNDAHTLSPTFRQRISYWQTAAVVLLILTTSVFYFWNQGLQNTANPEQRPIHYKAESGHQKALTLDDGTKIRLNSNAQLWISEDYGRDTREVTLKGEGYFEVIHNEKKPFIIHTKRTIIKDLGTAFNVRAQPGKENVQVAVTEGKLSIRTDLQSQQQAIELSEGEYGYLNLNNDSIRMDQFSVDNYLSWMNGRLKFKQATLDQVSTQLSRLYDISFTYSSVSLKQRALTADFERGSLKKTLEVISLTLGIEYHVNEERVIWEPATNKKSD